MSIYECRSEIISCKFGESPKVSGALVLCSSFLGYVLHNVYISLKNLLVPVLFTSFKKP